MNQPRTHERGERTVYTCMLWNVQSGRPTVVTVHDEHPDRWVGRRYNAAVASREPPLEQFLKSEWRREAPELEKPEKAAPVPDVRSRPRGFHP